MLVGPALLAHIGGRPYFALEVLDAALAGDWLRVGGPLPPPRSIEHILDSKLAKLSESCLDLVRLAAVAAPDLTPALVESVLSVNPIQLCAPLAELEAANVLRGLDFVHELMRSAALRLVPEALQSRLHELVAQHLESADAPAAEVARHWLAAGMWERCAHAFSVAAMDARRVNRLKEAAEFSRLSADGYQRVGNSELAIAAALQAMMSMGFGESPAAGLVFADALRIPCRTQVPAARLELIRGWALYYAGRYDLAAEKGAAILAMPGASDATVRIDASSLRAGAAGYIGAASESAILLSEVEALTALAKDEEVISRFRGTVATVALQSNRLDDARSATILFLAAPDVRRNADAGIHGLNNLCSIEMRRGNLEDALGMAERVHEQASGRDQAEYLVIHSQLNLGLIHSGLGNYRSAMLHLESALARLEATRTPARMFHAAGNGLGYLWIALGQYGRARLQLVEEPALPAERAYRVYARALLARAQGEDDSDLLSEAAGLASSDSWDVVRLGAETALVRHRLTGLPMLERYRELEQEARSRGFMGEAIRALSECVAAAVELGEVERCRADLPGLEKDALAYRDWTLYMPEVLHRCARGWQALGDESAAGRCMTAARSWVAQVARTHVPNPFVATFRYRQRQNLALARDRIGL